MRGAFGRRGRRNGGLVRGAVIIEAGEDRPSAVLQGFDAESIAAIRGLPDIDKDLEAFATRFLEPGTPSEGSTYPTGFYVAGSKPDGKQWWNYYGFVRCGDALVMNSVHEDARD